MTTGRRVLIIVPPVRLSQPPTRFPLGLAYVAAALEGQGIPVTVLDLNILRLPEDEEEAAVIGALRSADVICTGGMVTMLEGIDRILRLVKKHRPDIPVIAGGPLASHNQELILRHIPIDVLVRGEGEMVVPRLVQALDDLDELAQIPGLVLQRAGDAFFTREPVRISDLDAVEIPAYHLFSYDRYIANRGYPRSTDVITGRGCPYRCSFCFRNFGNDVIFRSIDNVVAEITHIASTYNVSHFYIQDEFFIQRKEYVRAFCLEMKRLGVTWAASTRANTLSYELLKELKESGCTMLMIGIESFSEPILKEMNKGVTVSQVEQVCRWMNEVGIEISPGLIIGMPGETRETIRETVTGCIRNRIPVCEWTYAFATPYPGTKLYDDARDKGLIPDEWEYIRHLCTVGDTRNMTLNLTTMPDEVLLGLREDAVRTVRKATSRRDIPSRVKGVAERAFAAARKKVGTMNVFQGVISDHFREDLDPSAQRSLFKAAVSMVEIEVFSFCNRKCWFCTNTIVDRHSSNAYMDADLYSRIIDSLAEIGYCNVISFSRYNEPLADDIIFERLRYARRKLPLATLHLNTNGDYLDTDRLHLLYEAGLRSLNLQVYLSTADLTWMRLLHQ